MKLFARKAYPTTVTTSLHSNALVPQVQTQTLNVPNTIMVRCCSFAQTLKTPSVSGSKADGDSVYSPPVMTISIPSLVSSTPPGPLMLHSTSTPSSRPPLTSAPTSRTPLTSVPTSRAPTVSSLVPAQPKPSSTSYSSANRLTPVTSGHDGVLLARPAGVKRKSEELDSEAALGD